MKGKYFNMYLSKERKEYIEKYTEGFSPYVNKKIDEDLAKLLDVDYCKKQKEFWDKQMELAKEKKKH